MKAIYCLHEFIERVTADRYDTFWYRGQRRAGLPLIPKVFREPVTSPRDERSRLNHFRMNAPLRRENCPKHEDRCAWLPLAQHYGLDTRLLDWTSSSLVALFFATECVQDGDDAVDGEIAVLDPYDLNRDGRYHVLASDGDADVTRMVDAAFEGHEERRTGAIAIVAPQVDWRMYVQAGRFTIHGDATPLGEHCNVEIIRVAARAKPAIREQLPRVGVSRAHLFPDLGNLAANLNSIGIRAAASG